MSDHADLDKTVRTYILVFVALMVGTLATVGAYYLDVSVPVALTIGLFIATVKASLVACFFMHLIDEKRVIYWALALTGAFLVALVALPLLTSVIDQLGHFTSGGGAEPH
ncbi:MAG: cytochrome C oxidase subunit IV family protein [Acidobacteria bacterium]|nr:cytochrome C oxidase subunit IV family protein [Acidobacteriota bacterium]MCY3964596.1 cytochrome C oxidase subunit IV family protein [Acidobacteriota bacterium]MCY3968574.1 cytochrome C oxidase subunit IV family protein [Acidobacteriota bacterium]